MFPTLLKRSFSATRPTSSLFTTYLEGIKKSVKEIPAAELRQQLSDPEEEPILIDVRETYEWNEEHIPNALYLGRGCLERDVEHYVGNVHEKVVVYCASGKRSILAADALQKMGYKNVSSLEGGIKAFKDAGGQVNANLNSFTEPILVY